MAKTYLSAIDSDSDVMMAGQRYERLTRWAPRGQVLDPKTLEAYLESEQARLAVRGRQTMILRHHESKEIALYVVRNAEEAAK